jgi:serine/threonine protein kinase
MGELPRCESCCVVWCHVAAVEGYGGECPIVRLFSVFETTEVIVLELELMSRSDLFDELSTSGVLKECKTASIVQEVGLFMVYHVIVIQIVSSCCDAREEDDQDGSFDDLTVSSFLQVVRAVEYCRSHNIAHRDIKLSNIIFPPSAQEDPAEKVFVKLADFGMAGFFGKDGMLRGR